MIKKISVSSIILLLTFLLTPHAVHAQQEPLTLERAVSMALRTNERALAAGERAAAAQARVRRARAAFMPTVSLIGTYTRRAFETVRMVGGEEITIQSLNALSATGNASLALIDPHLFPILGQAVHERDGAMADATEVQRMLAFEVCDAYLGVLSADNVLDAASRREELAQRNLAAAHARFDAQLTGSNDVTKAELEYATAQRARTIAVGSAESARLQLRLLLGVPPSDSLVAPGGLVETAWTFSASADSLILHAAERRPDLLASRARLEGLRASATEALLRFLPSIGLSAQYRITNEAGLSGKAANWFAGATLTWNLFDGGVWMADRSERSALARAAELSLSEEGRRVANDVRSALIALDVARATLRQSEAALRAAQTNSLESSARYAEGLGTALEAADANVSLFEAAVAHVRDQYTLIIAFLDVRAAIGLDPFGKEQQP